MKLFDSSKIPWRSPWCPVSPEAAAALEDELRKELAPEHVLQGHSVSAVGRRPDCDDVLFYLGEIGPPLAVVHLTWKREIMADWPDTEFFTSAAEFIETRMIPDVEAAKKE